MGSVSQSTRSVFFRLLLLCVVVDVHTAVVVTATSPFSAHVRGHTIGVTIDRGVFFCLLLVCVVVNFGYPICVIGSAGCGVFPLWFVMPCYAMVGCVRVMSVYKGYPDMSWFDQGIPC